MKPPPETRGSGNLRLHRAYYFTSVLRTLGFFGTVVLVCLAAPVLVALGISLFFLKFYRKEVGAFLRHPIRGLIKRRPEEFEGYGFEVLPPGSLGTPSAPARPRQDESS